MKLAHVIRTCTASAVALSALALALNASPVLAAPASGPVAAPWGPGLNLLSNPSHEHPGVYFAGRGEINVTWNWVPFWEEPPSGDNLRDQNYRTPEFRPVFANIYPTRVRTGAGADRWFNFFALNHAAGIMQVVNNLPVGQLIRFSTWAQLWSSNVTGDPPTSEQDGNMRIRICIQLDGGPRNMVSPNLKCSNWSQPYDKYKQISVDAVTTGPTILALLQSDASIPVQHNDAYVDDSCLEVLPSVDAAGICMGAAGFVPSAVDGNPAPAVAAPAVVASSAVTSTAAGAQTVANSALGLHIRSTPTITVSNIVGVAHQGDVLPVTGKSVDGKWFQIQFNSNAAWVFAALTTPNAVANTAAVVK
jgi:Bacterial SH3 domain